MRRMTVPMLALMLSGTSAMAGSAVVAPALSPPTGGRLRCQITNASDTKTLQVEWAMYDFNGNAVFGPVTSALGPNRNVRNGSPLPTTSSNCKATVLKGGKTNLRLALYAEDASGNIVAAVEGR